MITKTITPFSVLLLFSIMFINYPATRADTYLINKKHTDAYELMGKTTPAKEEVSVIWIAKDKARVDKGESESITDTSIILRLDKNAAYMLDHTKMIYVEIPLGTTIEETVTMNVDKKNEQSIKAIGELASAMMQMKVNVTDTGEKKNIKCWNCQKYIVKIEGGMGTTVSEIWATEDIKINYDLYHKMSSITMFKQPGFQGLFKEMEKIKGIIVLNSSSTEAMGCTIRSTEELVEVKEKSSPSDTYDIPKDYVKGGK